jgi:HAD superfamily hydrolase (TIGR01509 family)
MIKMQIDGIVFDLDGTLADTEPLHIDTWLVILNNLGLKFDESWMHQWIGLSDRLVAEHVCEHYLKDQSVENLQHIKQQTYRNRAVTEVKLFDQVEEHLLEMSQYVPIALATNSSREDVSAVFQATNLQKFLKVIVTANDVSFLKPNPEPYQTAASLLGINPSLCFALEDSPAGIHSAKNAGLFAIGVENSHPSEKLKEANLIFSDTPKALAYILDVLKSN